MQWPLVGRDSALESILGEVRAGTGVAILGPAGVGKSRLLHEIAAQVDDSGINLFTTVASASMSSVPFAPFAELLPPEATQDRLAMLGFARQALEERAKRGRVLVAIDDAHHLDQLSLAFLLSIVGSGFATVTLTARTGTPMAPDLVGLWVNGVMRRVDVASLDRSALRTLVASRLGELTEELEEDLWGLSRGNPLVLHEIIEGAVGVSITRNDQGIWQKSGSLARSARLLDLVGSRLKDMDDDLKPAMDAIAVGAPFSNSLARATLGPDLERLEEMSLVSWTDRAGQTLLAPAHPLYGEILKANMGEARIESAYERLAEAAARIGVENVFDPVQAAIWQLNSDQTLSEEVALEGARQALIRHDAELAVDLLTPFKDVSDRSGVLLATALSFLQEFADAEEILAGLDPADPELIAECASQRARNLGYGLGKVDTAREVLELAISAVDDPNLEARLRSESALISATVGDFGSAIESSELVFADSRLPESAKAAAYVTATVALTMRGDLTRMNQIIDAALDSAAAARESQPLAEHQIGVMYSNSLVVAGQIDKAIEPGIEGRDAGPMAVAWASVEAMAHSVQGTLRTAEAVTLRALQLYEQGDPFGLELQSRGLLALTRGQLNLANAGEAIDGVTSEGLSPRLGVWVDRGRAWGEVANGNVEEGARLAAAGGRRAIEGDHAVWGAFALHDAVRLGYPELVIEDLRRIDASRGAHLIELMRQHAEGLIDEDPEALHGIAVSFGRAGGWLFAAECFAQTSVLFSSRGQETEAVRAAALSAAWESMCEEPVTPALRDRSRGLSERELEVGLDAAAGKSSPEIAEARFISRRTVDNHLRSVYRKLGVGGREDLAALFSDVITRGRPTRPT